ELSPESAVARHLVNFMDACDRPLARCFVDVFAVGKLFLDNVDFCYVMKTLGPLTGPDANDAAHDLGDGLQHDKRPGHRNDELEIVERRAIRGDARMLVDTPGMSREVISGINEGQDAGNEEQNV